MEQKAKSSFRSLKDKIIHNRKGYPFRYNSIGSILTQVLMQEEHKRVNPSYSISSFTNNELFQAGNYISEKINSDLTHTQNLLEDILCNLVIFQGLDFKNPSASPESEFEYLKFLAKRHQSGLHLDEITKNRIEDIKKAKQTSQLHGGMYDATINLKIFDENALYSSFSKNARRSTPLKLVAYGSKTIESSIFKFLKTATDLLEMDNKIYQTCTKKCKKNYSKQDLIDTILMYQTSLFSSGEGIYQYHYQNGKINGEIRGRANDILEKFFGVDYTRARIVTTEHNMRYLQNVIRTHLDSSPNHNILASRDEDFFTNKEKDNSYVLGIEGPKQGCLTEIRIQTLQDCVIGEFGENSHPFVYKPKELRKYKLKFKNSPKIQSIGEKLTIMFPDKQHYIHSLFK